MTKLILERHVSPELFKKVLGKLGDADSDKETLEVKKYFAKDCVAGPLIYLGIGETWTQIPKKLSGILTNPDLPSYVHGYIIDSKGSLELRKVLESYIPKTHRIPLSFKLGTDYDIAVSTQGTRNVIFDYARYLQDCNKSNKLKPVAIVPLPGWDYQGIFDSLDYKVNFLHLQASNKFQFDESDIQKLKDQIQPDEYVSLIVINAQHNPSGTNWTEEQVKSLIEWAKASNASLLIDDAFYGICNPDFQQTSALSVLASTLADSNINWLQVRSLGKQFNCNGWGIGSVAAPPALMDTIMFDYFTTHSHGSATPLQYAMAKWLSCDDSTDYLKSSNVEYKRKKDMLAAKLINLLGYPETAFHVGPTTSYILMSIPPRFVAKAEKLTEVEMEFKMQVLEKTGVLFGHGSMMYTEDMYKHSTPQLRVFLGPPFELLEEAMDRLFKHGFTYE